MEPKQKSLHFGLIAFLGIDLFLLGACFWQIYQPFFHLDNYGLYTAGGRIAQAQGKLIITAVLIMLLVVLPVLITAYTVAFKYRAENNRDYQPDWGQKHWYLQFVWWAFPSLIILFISILMGKL